MLVFWISGVITCNLAGMTYLHETGMSQLYTRFSLATIRLFGARTNWIIVDIVKRAILRYNSINLDRRLRRLWIPAPVSRQGHGTSFAAMTKIRLKIILERRVIILLIKKKKK